MGRGELHDSFEGSLRARDAKEREVVRDGLAVHFRRYERRSENGLDFGAKDEMFARSGIEKRLYSDGIAREKKGIATQIQNREREYAVELCDAGRAVLFIQVKDNLRIGAGMEAMTGGLETGAKIFEIVNFAVENEPEGAVLIGHRLATRVGYINDCQAVVAERDAVGNCRRAEALDRRAIRPAMPDRARHPFNRGL